MPELSYEIWPSLERPDFSRYSQEKKVFDLKYDVIPFNGRQYKGVIKCEGGVIDSFRGYAYCKVEDEKGNELFLSGWEVDLSPLDARPAEWVRGARVKVYMGGRPDFLRSDDFVVHDEEVKRKVEVSLKEAEDKGSNYAGITIYIFPASEFYEENRELSERTGRLAEVRKEVEEAFGL